MKIYYFLQNMPFGIQINPIFRDKFGVHKKLTLGLYELQ